jgi:RNA polymerase sigma-70 factor (family 1)
MDRNFSEDQKAFDAMFMKYYPGLVRFSKSMLRSSQDEAEDVVQDVLLKFWQDRKTISIHTGLSSFLYTAVKNKVMDHFRKHSYPSYNPFDLSDDQKDSNYLLPDQVLMFKELNVDIEQMISSLPERSQLVFRMNREDQLTYEEIARLLGISLNSVKTHMYRSIKFLKEVFERYNSLS